MHFLEISALTDFMKFLCFIICVVCFFSFLPCICQYFFDEMKIIKRPKVCFRSEATACY